MCNACSQVFGSALELTCHRTATTALIDPHNHSNFPETGKRTAGTGRDHALVRQSIVESVGVEGRRVLVDGQRGVVGEVGVVEHLEHGVTARLQEGRPHAPHVLPLHAAVQRQDLPLAVDLLQPLLLRELLTETVPAIFRRRRRLATISTHT